MNCWHCKAGMIWQADFDYQDYGLEGEGIISEFVCSECDALATVYLPLSTRDFKGPNSHELF